MKLPGVESAEVSLKRASADIRLKPDNTITMAELRKVLKENGYPTRDAQIEARGRIVASAGGMAVDLLNGTSMQVEGNDAAATPSEALVEISATSRAHPNAPDGLMLKSVKQ